MSRTRVLVVDDSAIVRKIIGDTLRADPDIEVVGGAADPYQARELILSQKPDLLTLDIEMPRMDGLTFLKTLMAHRPMPVIVVSSLTQAGSTTALEALRLGAIDVIGKPGGPREVGLVGERLRQRIRALRASPQINYQASARLTQPAPAAPQPVRRKVNGLLVIGASTGGPPAIESLLTRLPADIPPTLIVQHMPASFTRAFSDRLNSVSPMRVVEAQGGEVLARGTVYVAPGDHHLVVERRGIELRTALTRTDLVHFQRPAVDVLFQSVARLPGIPVVGVLLTGMGADGADGMVALRRAGAETIAEDELSCVVFGMPKEAINRGGACHVTSLLQMPNTIFDCFDTLTARRVA